MIRIIYEDDTLLALDKPSGLTVTPADTQKEKTLVDWLKNYLVDQGKKLEREGIVHRLDKDTSGLMLVAKTPQALTNLQSQFKSRVVKKEYLALVHGWVEKGGLVEGIIGRNPKNREKFTMLGPIGRLSVTEYESIRLLVMSSEFIEKIFYDFNNYQMRKLERMDYRNFTLIRCFPKTGRTHQIRVHLKYIGHPVVADQKYVGRKMSRLDKRWCKRQFLHAKRIGFFHPVSGKWLEFESELPEDLENALSFLSGKL